VRRRFKANGEKRTGRAVSLAQSEV